MKTILVVDDDQAIRTFVHKALSKRGWTVLEAEDGIDGTARFMLHSPDVLLTDISMPRSDGFAMIRHLRIDHALHGVRVVLMSGILDFTRDQVQETGAHAVLRKPFNLKDLYAAVGEPEDEAH